MKKKTFLLFITIFILSFFNCLMAQNSSSTKERGDGLFGSSIYVGAGYGYGYYTRIWTDYPYSAITGKIGNRWKLKGSRLSKYNFGIQFTWLTVSINENNSQQIEYFPFGIGFAGIGISNMFRINKSFGIEVNINLMPHVQKKSNPNNRYIGPMLNLELRMRYKAFYVGLDSGISINISVPDFILGGYSGLKLGFNLIAKE
ncbi:MAG: hypothetical protein WED10_07330 [Brumimicrobium sp.]